jgi:hypothetical protein
VHEMSPRGTGQDHLPVLTFEAVSMLHCALLQETRGAQISAQWLGLSKPSRLLVMNRFAHLGALDVLVLLECTHTVRFRGYFP